MPYDVSFVKFEDAYAFDVPEHVDGFGQAAFLVAGQVDLGGVAGDARVENTVSVTIFFKSGLKQRRPGLADFHAESGAEAVADDYDRRRWRRLRFGQNGNRGEYQEKDEQNRIEPHENL